MSAVNHGTLIGNIGQDAKLETTGSGTKYCRLSIAQNKRFKDKSGETQKKTEWFNFTLWGKQAEILHSMIKKGTQVALHYELTPRSQEIEGKKISTYDIRVMELELLGGGKSREGSGSATTLGDDPDFDMDDLPSSSDND